MYDFLWEKPCVASRHAPAHSPSAKKQPRGYEERHRESDPRGAVARGLDGIFFQNEKRGGGMKGQHTLEAEIQA